MLTPYTHIHIHASCKNPFIEGYHTAVLLCLFKWHYEACKEVENEAKVFHMKTTQLALSFVKRRFLNFTHRMWGLHIWWWCLSQICLTCPENGYISWLIMCTIVK